MEAAPGGLFLAQHLILAAMKFEFCLPTRATTVPAAPEWFHEVKYDGCRPVYRHGRRTAAYDQMASRASARSGARKRRMRGKRCAGFVRKEKTALGVFLEGKSERV